MWPFGKPKFSPDVFAAGLYRNFVVDKGDIITDPEKFGIKTDNPQAFQEKLHLYLEALVMYIILVLEKKHKNFHKLGESFNALIMFDENLQIRCEEFDAISDAIDDFSPCSTLIRQTSVVQKLNGRANGLNQLA